MLTGIFMGLLSAIALVIILARLGLRKFMGYPVALDICGSVLFCLLFAGTLTGMMVAVVAGLALSGIVYIVRSVVGYDRWDRKQGWVHYPSSFQLQTA